jgi:uncharacterized iron-regulated membrane protein
VLWSGLVLWWKRRNATAVVPGAADAAANA